jgi:hypothetical protein
MRKIKVTKEDIGSLEFKANLAYETLKKGCSLTTKPWILSSAKVLYEHDLGRYIRDLIRPTQEVVALRKGHKETEKIEGYVLQYLLMSDSCPIGSREDYPEVSVDSDPDDWMGGLKAYIDADDAPDATIGVVFRTLQDWAKGIREYRPDLILKAIEYVREKYSKPEA